MWCLMLSKSESGMLGYLASKEKIVEQTKKRIDDYQSNPISCGNCSSALPYEKRYNKFCSQSCAATTNNKVTKQPKSTYVCLGCGVSGEKKQSTIRKFCSNGCQQKYQSKQIFEMVEAGNAENEGQVKRYLINKHGNVCLDDNCAWDFSKRPVNVELEHKDGNAKNNTLENCTLLCPNCHSTTSTYKAKNKGKGTRTRKWKKTSNASLFYYLVPPEWIEHSLTKSTAYKAVAIPLCERGQVAATELNRHLTATVRETRLRLPDLVHSNG